MALAGWAESGRAGPVVQLQGWAGEGVLIRGNGQGPDLVQLVAEADWDRAASRDPARYRVRVTLPGGRTETRAFPVETPPGQRRFSAFVPAAMVRNLAPSEVRVGVTVVDSVSGADLSNVLEATIGQFPRPRGDASGNDPGPFGWGKPLDGAERVVPNPGPDGLIFARIPAQGDAPGFFLATTEATVQQLADRLPGYDPKLGRSDEFAIEGPDLPAVGLTPSRALDYLKALGQADASGVTYRLPTAEEWTRAALGGKPSSFWWGDQATYIEGANFLGDEPGRAGDSTAPSRPLETSPTFRANPSGLFHTFGNVAEWATVPSGGFARMGGHFRTEPASPLPEVALGPAGEVGPDPFVGVRPAFDLSPEAGAGLARKRLGEDPTLGPIAVAYDPERSTITLTGKVAEASARRSADRLLEGLWFVKAVEDRLESPEVAPNQLARLGVLAAPIRKVATLGETFLEVNMTVRWLDPLPVVGSEWWANIYLPNNAGHFAHKLDEGIAGRSGVVRVLVDRARLAALGLGDDTPMTIALSLGAPAPTTGGSNIASNVAIVRPPARPGPP